MVTFEPLRVKHFEYITPHAVQSEEMAYLSSPGAQEALQSGIGLTAWAQGRCLGASGINRPWPGRGEAWALFSAHAKPYMLAIVRKMKHTLLLHDDLVRIDFSVRAGNKIGMQFARMLGFELEAVLRRYHPSGDDVLLFAKVR